MLLNASTPEERYNYVLERISQASSISGRSARDITLVGVTKGQNLDNIKKFIDLGLKNIGESYFQEAITKIPKITSFDPSVNIHFIGHLQSNKVKKVLSFVDLIHSIDSLKLINELNKRVKQINEKTELKISDPFPVLVQVNLSGETSKSGCSPENTLSLVQHIMDNSPHVTCTGLMSISPFEAVNEEKLKSFYKLVNEHYSQVKDSFPKCKELSCGMSNDFEIAIEKGSTIVRLGTILLGARAK